MAPQMCEEQLHLQKNLTTGDGAQVWGRGFRNDPNVTHRA